MIMLDAHDQVIALLLFLFILMCVSAFAIKSRRDLIRVRYLMGKGYQAKEIWCGEVGWEYTAPDDKDTYDLSDAYKRQRLIDERIRLNIPEDAKPAYRLGDFAK